jgi:acyl-CoA synthetase (AMP-forming)/AMP-acid ligase II
VPIQHSPRFSLVPYPVLSLTRDLTDAADRVPDKVALIDGVGGASYTYTQVVEASMGLARALQDDGIEPGDRIGLVSPNCCEWVIVFWASLFCGATVTTLNPLYTEREIAHQFGDSQPKAAFVADACVEATKAVWGDKPGLHVTSRVWDLAAGSAGAPDEPAFDPKEHLAVLPYSSGTTGAPKGVMLSHYNLTSNIRQTLGCGLIDEYSVLINFLPFFHIYGMAVLMMPGLAAGATQVILPGFDPKRFLEVVQTYRATNLFMVPPAMLVLANSGEGADLSSVKYIMSGAAPLPIDVARRVEDLYDCQVFQGYGMTEASPVTHITVMGRNKPGTVGPPVADTRQKVVDLVSGDELPIGEIGELLVDGPQVMLGYFNRPDATAESIVEDSTGRWLRTGDIVSVDDEGYVTVHDRAKEMIKYKGYQIAPAELEAVLIEHPDIADAAVIPVDTGTVDGEIPKAFVVVREGASLTIELIMEHVSGKVAPYKKLRDVEFVDKIPKNPSGKILRRELKAAEKAKTGA